MLRCRRKPVPSTPASISMRAVKQVWSAVTEGKKPWPKGWKVVWGSVDDVNDTDGGQFKEDDSSRIFPATKTIKIDYEHARRHRNALGSLVHELAHLHVPELGHGVEFRRILQKFRKRVGLGRSSRPTKAM